MISKDKSQYITRYAHAVQTFLESPETDIEFCRELLWELKSEYDNITKKIARWAFYGLIFICIFELLNRRLIINASLSGIQIGRLNFLLYFLPPAVAFCMVNMFSLYDEQTNYENVMRELVRQKFSGLHASKINLLFMTSFGLLSNETPEEFAAPIGRFNSVFYTTVQILLLLIGPIVFEAYAYVQLFGHAEHFNTVTFISLLVTASFIIMLLLRWISAWLDPAVAP